MKSLLLPPNLLLIGLVLGLALYRMKPLWGRTALIISTAGLWLLSMPIVATYLHYAADGDITSFRSPQDARVIVILSAGLLVDPPETNDAAAVDALSLERLRYGAALHRQTGLPILVTGGPWGAQKFVIADYMASSLIKDFGVTAKWRERRAQNTAQNALYSAKMLRSIKVDKIVLVTHAWHMPRAKLAFENAGIEVIPAPTAYYGSSSFSIGALAPSPSALRMSYFAIHELVGTQYYRLRL